MLNLIYKIYTSIINDYEQGRWGRLVFKAVTTLIVLICMGIVIYTTGLLIVTNIQEIVVTIGAVFCFFAVILNFFPKKQEPAPQESNLMEYDTITLEATYNIIRKNLCMIIGETGEMTGLRKPASFSQMDAPNHFDIKGNVPIYHYLALKSNDSVDCYAVAGILQTALEQKLNNNEIEGIRQNYFFYRSQAYPSIMVDNVQDCGSHIQIDMAITSEQYCQFRERRTYHRISSGTGQGPADRDF